MTIVMKAINRTCLPNLCAKKRERRRKAGTSISISGKLYDNNCPDCGISLHVCLLEAGDRNSFTFNKTPRKEKRSNPQVEELLSDPPTFGEIGSIIQIEPTEKEQVIHEEIKATMLEFQRAAVDALRSFSRAKG